MNPFINHSGITAVLDRPDIDTDQIIPAKHLKRIEKTGFGIFLFERWRILENGQPNPKFELNNPNARNATILITGRNFGSGSSREHAVWALSDYGFKVIIASSFADIFQKNCFENGLVPALLPEKTIKEIIDQLNSNEIHQLSVDLETCTITDNKNLCVPFVVHQDNDTHIFRRHCLMNGLDTIGLTLAHKDKISAYEASHE